MLSGGSAPGPGLVLKDRLLTDSVLLQGEEFPVVKQEHSYSLNGTGSDGDSIPASPLSLQDGMFIYLFICLFVYSFICL